MASKAALANTAIVFGVKDIKLRVLDIPVWYSYWLLLASAL